VVAGLMSAPGSSSSLGFGRMFSLLYNTAGVGSIPDSLQNCLQFPCLLVIYQQVETVTTGIVFQLADITVHSCRYKLEPECYGHCRQMIFMSK
jgi:hypothetical protein